MPNAQHKYETRCTLCWRPSSAEPAAASLLRTISKGLGGIGSGKALGKFSNSSPSSRTMNKSERPSSFDRSSVSESKRNMRARRSVQSSSNSHLRYISTSGSSCTHVLRITCRGGRGKCVWRLHTNWPVPKNNEEIIHEPHKPGTQKSSREPKTKPKRRKHKSLHQNHKPSLECRKSDSCRLEFE